MRIAGVVSLALFAGFLQAKAADISLFDYGLNIDGTFSASTDPMPPNASFAGFDLNTGLGALQVAITGTGQHYVGLYVDHEIDEVINTFFNEYGSAVGVPPVGLSWEIDEPGFVFGDIYDHVTAGELDNSNAVPAGSEDDVSMALGWDFVLEPGEQAVISMLLSTVEPSGGFYLEHYDPHTEAGVYFSGRLRIIGDGEVPDTGTSALLMSLALFGLGAFGRVLKCGDRRGKALLVALLGSSLAMVAVSRAQSLPDLRVATVDTSAAVTDCQTLALSGTVFATVQNEGGSATAVGFKVVFFDDLDDDASFTPAIDIVLAEVDAPEIQPGEAVTVSAPVAGTTSFVADLVYAFADASNQIAESNEANNIANSGELCIFQPEPGSFRPVLEWSWTSTAVQPSSLNVMMTPSVIDLTGDGVPEVVFGSTASTGGGLAETGVLRALNGATGAEAFTVTDPAYAISTTASVATGDIDNDGRPEIIASDSSGIRLIAFEHDGTFKWRSPNLEFVYWGAPALADIDEDGTPEIILGRQVLNANGTIRWTGAGGRASQGNVGSISCVADVNMDGSPDVVAGNTVYRANGTVLWQAPLPDGHNALANFDADSFPEIVLVANANVWLLEHTGAVKWGPVGIPGAGAGGPPTIADYDNDGQVEIGVAGASRYAVYETDGTLKWAAVTQDASSNRTGSSVYDFDGDGSAEVVYRDELYLRVYRGTDGVVLFQTPMSSCTWHEYVLVADVDADGNAEIVAVANNNCGYGPQRGVFVFGDQNDNWVATRRIWNQHTYHITNVGNDGSIPQEENNSWQSFNNYRQNVQNVGPVLAAPDLTTSFLRFDPSGCPGSATIVARIGNGGANVASAPVKVAFYTDGPGGSLLGVTQTTTSLEPGEWEDVTLLLAPPPPVPATICAVVDDDGTGVGNHNECNEQNNDCCAQFEAFCGCVDDLSARPKPGKVQLVWGPTGAQRYNIYRATVSGGPYQQIGSTTSTYSTYLDTSVSNGTTYYYVVREATAGNEEICQSNEVRVTPTATRR